MNGDIEFHELTGEEWSAGQAATLDRLGCTEAELERMAVPGRVRLAPAPEGVAGHQAH